MQRICLPHGNSYSLTQIFFSNILAIFLALLCLVLGSAITNSIKSNKLILQYFMDKVISTPIRLGDIYVLCQYCIKSIGSQ